MNVAKFRKLAGLRQVDLADKLALDRSTVAKWETGEALPRAALLPKLAETLNCSIDALLAPDESCGEPDKGAL